MLLSGKKCHRVDFSLPGERVTKAETEQPVPKNCFSEHTETLPSPCKLEARLFFLLPSLRRVSSLYPIWGGISCVIWELMGMRWPFRRRLKLQAVLTLIKVLLGLGCLDVS